MLSNVKVDVNQINNQLDFLQALISDYPNLANMDVFEVGNQIKFLNSFLPQVREEVNQASRLVKIIPSILAFEDKKTYLVIFQNNAEIRPTGGFIGSYGFLTFEKGRLLDFSVEDVYTADGQLKGHVEPPAPLKKHLGQAGWYLRDANWNPHFPTSASQIKWFLQKEIGRRVDGVVAFNLNAAQIILKTVGSVELPDYGEEISAENLFERAENHAEIDFFPGSTQKKDFLGNLSNQLFEKIKSGQPEDWVGVLTGLKTGLDKKEILLNFNDVKSQRVISNLGFSGAIRQITNQAGSLADYLFIVEANVGVNKANYFLKRQIDQQITFLKDLSNQQKITIDYDNQSPSQSWPAGDYKAYIRLYVPEQTKLKNLTIKNPGRNENILDQPEIQESEEQGKKVIGFYFVVPVGEKRQLSLKLKDSRQLPFQKGDSSISSYRLYWQKQSGAHSDPITVQVDYPTFIRPFKITPQGKVSASSVFFEDSFNTDKVFTIDFKR